MIAGVPDSSWGNITPHYNKSNDRMDGALSQSPESLSEEAERVFRKLETLWMGEASEPFSDKALELAYDPVRLGGMEDADAMGRFTDGCGDVLEVFLKIRKGRIVRASFLSDGCGASIACGSATVQLAEGMTLDEAAEINDKTILEFLGGLPRTHRHSAADWWDALRDAVRNASAFPDKTR